MSPRCSAASPTTPATTTPSSASTRAARGSAPCNLPSSRHERPARPVSRVIALEPETDSPCCNRGPDRPLAYPPGVDGSSQTEGESSVHKQVTALSRASTLLRIFPWRGGPPREQA